MHQALFSGREDESFEPKIEWRVTPVNSAMMIRTDQHEIFESVVPPTA
jgi:hypothetical protein